MPPSPTYKIVFAVIERGARRHWLRVGLAFPNRDGSLNVRLDAVPFTGQLHIRDPNRSEGGEAVADLADPSPQTTPPEARTERKPRS
jgi:hypothetical protein